MSWSLVAAAPPAVSTMMGRPVVGANKQWSSLSSGGQYGERQLRESVGPNDDAVDPEDPLLFS